MKRALLLALFLGCSGEDPGPLVSRACTEGGKTYEPGKTWTCADGCNTCSCNDDGTVSTTLIGCSEGGVDSGGETATDGGVEAATDGGVEAATDSGVAPDVSDATAD